MTAGIEAPPNPVAPHGTPNWAEVPKDVCCPLCEYNLRGLVEPRCPECGYAFEWTELLDEELHKHPYLFEHHRRRNVESFFKTHIAGFRPAKFWRTLQPTQPSNVRRLVMYWILSIALVSLALLFIAALHCYRLNQYLEVNRKAMTADANRDPSTMLYVTRQSGSLQAYLDANFPRMDTGTFWRWAWASLVDDNSSGRFYLPYDYMYRSTSSFIAAAILYVLWPWLSMGALLVFQASMRRARIQSHHVLRAVLYSGDASWLMVALAVMVIPQLVLETPLKVFGSGVAMRIGWAILFALFTTWRLRAAYRHYLRFDRPLLTVAAAQLIVLLTVTVFVVNWTDIGL